MRVFNLFRAVFYVAVLMGWLGETSMAAPTKGCPSIDEAVGTSANQFDYLTARRGLGGSSLTDAPDPRGVVDALHAYLSVPSWPADNSSRGLAFYVDIEGAV